MHREDTDLLWMGHRALSPLAASEERWFMQVRTVKAEHCWELKSCRYVWAKEKFHAGVTVKGTDNMKIVPMMDMVSFTGVGWVSQVAQ